MKHSEILKFLFLVIFTAMCTTSCTTDEETTPTTRRRTIMMYFNSEALNVYANTDLNEIVEGAKSLPDDCNLVVYFDDYYNKPCIYQITKNGKEIIKQYDTDLDSSSPTVIQEIFQFMIDSYPTQEYVTVFWGHGTGPEIKNASAKAISKAYGEDLSSGESWIDIPNLANVMENLGIGKKNKIIMFDACLLQSVEIAYELKDYAEYIVGSCSETPTIGAPYKYMIPVLAESDIKQCAKDIVNTYIDKNTWGIQGGIYADKSDGICISAVSTDKLDNLLQITEQAIDTISYDSTDDALNLSAKYTESTYSAVTSCIFYWLTTQGGNIPLYYDMNDVMMHNLCAKDYKKWKEALDAVVIEKRHPRDIRELSGEICDWIPATLNSRSYYTYFLLNDETYGGLSMFVPRKIYNNVTTPSPNMNKNMFKYKWFYQIWKDKGLEYCQP